MKAFYVEVFTRTNNGCWDKKPVRSHRFFTKDGLRARQRFFAMYPQYLDLCLQGDMKAMTSSVPIE